MTCLVIGDAFLFFFAEYLLTLRTQYHSIAGVFEIFGAYLLAILPRHLQGSVVNQVLKVLFHVIETDDIIKPIRMLSCA